MQLQTQVIEIEPGWVLVKFHGPRPEAESRPFWLRRTLDDWLAQKPGRGVPRRTMTITDGGELVGVLVWLGEAPAERKEVPMQLHPSLLGKIPLEHAEALVEQAYAIWFSHPFRGPISVVNRSGIAVVFDTASERGYIMPLDQVTGLDDKSRQLFAAWQTAGEGNNFVFNLAGGFWPAE